MGSDGHPLRPVRGRGRARRGVDPMPVVELLVASAETVLPGPVRCRAPPPRRRRRCCAGSNGLARRLVRTTDAWFSPAAGAGRWRPFMKAADMARGTRSALTLAVDALDGQQPWWPHQQRTISAGFGREGNQEPSGRDQPGRIEHRVDQHGGESTSEDHQRTTTREPRHSTSLPWPYPSRGSRQPQEVVDMARRYRADRRGVRPIRKPPRRSPTSPGSIRSIPAPATSIWWRSPVADHEAIAELVPGHISRFRASCGR